LRDITDPGEQFTLRARMFKYLKEQEHKPEAIHALLEEYIESISIFYKRLRTQFKKRSLLGVLKFQEETGVSTSEEILFAACTYLYRRVKPEIYAKEPFQVYFAVYLETDDGDGVLQRTLCHSCTIDPKNLDVTMNNFLDNLTSEIREFCEQYKDSTILQLDLYAYYRHEIDVKF
jgi:hypothetical protein